MNNFINIEVVDPLQHFKDAHDRCGGFIVYADEDVAEGKFQQALELGLLKLILHKKGGIPYKVYRLTQYGFKHLQELDPFFAFNIQAAAKRYGAPYEFAADTDTEAQSVDTDTESASGDTWIARAVHDIDSDWVVFKATDGNPSFKSAEDKALQRCYTYSGETAREDAERDALSLNTFGVRHSVTEAQS